MHYIYIYIYIYVYTYAYTVDLKNSCHTVHEMYVRNCTSTEDIMLRLSPKPFGTLMDS